MTQNKEPKFRSGLEKKIYHEAMERGHTLEYEPSKPVISYTVTSRYTPDLRIGDNVYVEIKGWLRPRDRAKMLRVKHFNPELDIRFVFQRANSKLSKSPNSLTYGEWATKHGYLWSEGTIPENWFD